jgi:hypothetical protein
MRRSPTKPLPSQEILRHLFDYDHSTGNLLWKNPALRSAPKPGSIAGTILNHGYRQIKIQKQVYLAHRLVWTWVYGEDPGEYQIDHIDRNKLNNRIENLRKVTHLGNLRNQGAHPRNKLGIRGISKHGNRFAAFVRYEGRDIRKSFFTLEEAIEFKSQLEHKLWN